jgi:hypothetical protein
VVNRVSGQTVLAGVDDPDIWICVTATRDEMHYPLLFRPYPDRPIGGDPTGTGWSGPGIYPYGGDTVDIERFAQGEQDVEAFGKEGQVLYRKLDQTTGLPVPDTDTAADWAQATDDTINGKEMQYPGWDLEEVVSLHSACPCSLVQKVSKG